LHFWSGFSGLLLLWLSLSSWLSIFFGISDWRLFWFCFFDRRLIFFLFNCGFRLGVFLLWSFWFRLDLCGLFI